MISSEEILYKLIFDLLFFLALSQTWLGRWLQLMVFSFSQNLTVTRQVYTVEYSLHLTLKQNEHRSLWYGAEKNVLKVY